MTFQQNTYRVTWRDPFWGTSEEGSMEATDLQDAMAAAPQFSAEGLLIHEVAGPDGTATCEVVDPVVHNVRILAEVDGGFTEATVEATSLTEAIERGAGVLGPGALMRGFMADARIARVTEVPDGFWERPDLPEGWGERDRNHG